MRLLVIPTRGMGIWKAIVGDETLGWRSPVRGPVHPQFVPLFDPSGLGWLEGFDELLVRCGLESNGAPEFDQQGRLLYPLHGRIANRPAHHVEVTVDDTAVRRAKALAGPDDQEMLRRLQREWEAAVDLAKRASPTGSLLPRRRWMVESIFYRAPMIHPLNLLQIEVLGSGRLTKASQSLFQETVTGIAAGMLTTG